MTRSFEVALEGLLQREFEQQSDLVKVEWLHLVNRHINRWCFEKAVKLK